jgi:hypothetical protein
MGNISRRHVLTTVTTVVLSLLFAQLPNTSAPAAVYCLGPAAYPPDLPDCLDPVVEAQKVAKQQADDAAATATAAALKAAQDKAAAATNAMNDAKAKAKRTSEVAAAVATDLKTVTNQVVHIQTQVSTVAIQEKTVEHSITATQQDLDASIKEYEKTRIDISSYVATFNAVKFAADTAAQNAAEKRDLAARSKVIADNAQSAYRSAAGIKNLISTEKLFTVENTPVGADIQTTASAADIAKLKQLADRAAARYTQDQRAADIAAKVAAKTLADFQRIKSVLEAKVAAGRTLQEKIRTMQDQLASHRQSLAIAEHSKNVLTQKLRNTQSLLTAKLNDLSVAQVEAQKAKVIADQAALVVTQHRTDASNADKVATANEAAIEAAKAAAIAVSDSSNSIDRIVASNAVNNSIASLPMIFSAVAFAAAALFFATVAIRRYRRGGSAPLPTFTEPDLDIQFDFDRILSEYRVKEEKRQARTATAKATSVRKATVKKAAPKKR